jgi:hypothetical protein
MLGSIEEENVTQTIIARQSLKEVERKRIMQDNVEGN